MEEELLNNDLGESATEDLEEEEPKQIQAPRKKKPLNENQRKAVALNLAKGRENLKKKQEQQRKEREERKEEMKNVKEEFILSKAQKIKEAHQKKVSKVKSKIEPPEFELNSKEVFDEEEVVITKKPKKKRIIYKEESDSEEEVIVRKSKPKQPVEIKKQLLQFF